MPRKFAPGDWVKLKGRASAPQMKVLKYIAKKDAVFGLIDTDTYLKCVWYKNGERKLEVFHQNRLIKMIKTRGLYKT